MTRPQRAALMYDGAVEVEALDIAQRERDLFCHCLDLASTDEPGPLIEQTLRLLRDTTGAAESYVELRELRSGRTQRWAASSGLDLHSLADVQGRISTTIVSDAIAAGETILTASALLDARFRGRESVRRGNIEAVLCVPLTADGISGVIYLQNPSSNAPFSRADVERVEIVARYVSALADRLVELSERRDESQGFRELRYQLVLDGVIGRSPALLATLRRVAVVASMRGNVLLTGASGTGKSLFARVLHDNSERADGPFVEINCAALPESLFESELFGAERGAHSGATQRRMPGKIEAANAGTLFLDEIGELRRENQAKLLHFLQSHSYFSLGATTPRSANVRVVAATNRDLGRAVRSGEFREDLYYRLRGVEIRVPLLEERRPDIPELARHFCQTSCERNGLPLMSLSAAAVSSLEFADWPGNIRELAHRCEAAVVNARIEGVSTIELRHVLPSDDSSEPSSPSFHAATASFQRAFLARALVEHGWNVAATARSLEMSRSHLNSLISRFDLSRDDEE